MSKSDQDDFPSIGERSHGMVLVCRGDDWPDEFAGWLQSLADDFNTLSSIASEYGFDLDLHDGSPAIENIIDFCQRLGIQFDSNMWEGSLTSGIYHTGWIQVGTVRTASAQGRKLIRTLEAKIDTAIRSAVLQELQGIKQLDGFLDRTANDRHVLRQKIAELNSSLQVTQSALDEANERLSEATDGDTTEIDRACIRLAAALLAGEKCRLIAGPLVLWDDGILYAICSWGGNPIPEGSSPSVLLEAVQKSGRRVVRVRDATIIGGWLGRELYRKSPPNINGWSDVWALREKRPRTFSVDPPEFTQQVLRIHELLASAGG